MPFNKDPILRILLVPSAKQKKFCRAFSSVLDNFPLKIVCGCSPKGQVGCCLDEMIDYSIILLYNLINMVNPFDKNFMKFLFGFICILCVSFIIMFIVGQFTSPVL